MINTWFVLLPAFLVLAITIATKKLNYALLTGIIAAALIAQSFSLTATGNLLYYRLYHQLTDRDNIYLYAFLFILGIIITLLEHNGGAAAFAQLLTKHLRSKRSAETASAIISTTLFMDDYLSCLVTGYVMRPITDSFTIARTKLAFLIHSLSSPLVILAPISSWVALITSQLDKAGISPIQGPTTRLVADPFFIYLKSIPFIFYSLLIIASVWFIIRFEISYGPLHEEEKIARTTGNLFGGKPSLPAPVAPPHHGTAASATDLLLPIGVLISAFIFGIAWSGGYTLFGSCVSFLDAVQKNTQTSLMLLIASLITLAVGLMRGFYRKSLTLNTLPILANNGFKMMESSMLIVFLASTFGLMLREDLQTGTYLATTFLHAVNIFLLPLIFYMAAITIALITGSAWGTIALLVPLSVQILATITMLPLETILYPTLGAIFSGAVCGNHISPIAETTIMSANSAGCYPIAHAYTQFWYSLPAIVSAGISFLISGFLLSYSSTANIAISLAGGIFCCFSMLLLANIWQKKSAHN